MKVNRQSTAVGLVIFGLAVLHAPSLYEYIRLSLDPWIYNDDVRIHIYPFYSYVDSKLFANDYISRYCLSLSPVGQRFLFAVTTRFCDPSVLSKLLPCILYLILLAATGLAAFRLGGTVTAVSSLAMVLSSYIFLYHMTGGLPRSWAFPIMSLVAAMLVCGRIYALCALVIFAAAFYPPVAVVCGTALFIALFGLPKTDRGEAKDWKFSKRTSLLIITLGVALLIVLLDAPSLQSYGRRLGPADVAAYPELGPRGRYGFDDRPPFPGVLVALADAFGRALQGGADAWLPFLREWISNGYHFGDPASIPFVAVVAFIGLITLAGTFRLAARDPAARRLLALPAAACVCYCLAIGLTPLLFLPQRYMIYPIAVLTPLLVPAAAAVLFSLPLPFRGRHSRFCMPPPNTSPVGLEHPPPPMDSASRGDASALRSALLPAFILVILAFLGGPGGGATGLVIRIDTQRPLYTYMASLPEDAVIAGWPDGPLDNVPYLCRRRAFVTFETHQVQHQDYTEEMRRRMRALIDAYFGATRAPLLRLRNDFGVTHLLVDLSHFGPSPPGYFEPFDLWTRQAHAEVLRKGSEVLRVLQEAAIFQEGRFALLDLKRIDQ